ncbi:hypothetical protein SNEBB_009134, partial [Seison nebaliae]
DTIKKKFEIFDLGALPMEGDDDNTLLCCFPAAEIGQDEDYFQQHDIQRIEQELLEDSIKSKTNQ